MRIAIMGTRGVPASYGGFETLAEELGARLVNRGHQVTVYGRSHVVPEGLRDHRGMRLRIFPTIQHKYLDTVVHTAICVLDGLFRRFDAVIMCNIANAPFAIVPRLTGAKVALNVDGLEWERGKWNRLGRWYYKACARLAAKLPVALVSDAKVIAQYYRERFGRQTVFIAYGSDVGRMPPGEVLAGLGLETNGYFLYVSRLEPENNAHVVIEGYRLAGGLARLGVPLVVVGDAPYATAYKARLEASAMETPGVRLSGYVFGKGYAELQSNALAYIQATEVGGTHPALVEAMGRGRCIIANEVPEHREVLGDAGRYYALNDPAALATQMQAVVDDPAQRDHLGAAAAARAAAAFSWDHVTDEYERLLQQLAGLLERPESDTAIRESQASRSRRRRALRTDGRSLGDPATFELLGVRINAAPFAEVLDRVLRAPDTGDRLALHFATAHTLVETQGNAHLREALRQGLVEPDGMPLVWLGGSRGRRVERVCGPDFMPAVVENGIRQGRTHFFYGGAAGVPEALAARLAARYPGMEVAGTLSPPFRALSSAEDEAIIAEINAAEPDYVWVGLGSPKQDLWVATHRSRLNAPVLLAVGAAFDFHAGRLRRAPRWIQRRGMEWLFRWATEPRRLAGRYTRTNASFIRLVMQERLRRLVGRS
jgi:exopolysaccharide biosynthesis WecB/TagA/CpsF family protein